MNVPGEETEEELAGQEVLSSREKEIITCVVKGMTNKEIADALYLSAHTVITHRRNIARKLQIHSPAGLTIYAIVNKLGGVAGYQRIFVKKIPETIRDFLLFDFNRSSVFFFRNYRLFRDIDGQYTVFHPGLNLLFTTSSGKIIACWKRVYENSRLR